jgi:hypothetical protein
MGNYSDQVAVRNMGLTPIYLKLSNGVKQVTPHLTKRGWLRFFVSQKGHAPVVVLQENDDRREAYQESICISLAYLLKLQCIHRCATKEMGGFELSLSDRTQRIDVIGHYVNAMIKSLNNQIVR